MPTYHFEKVAIKRTKKWKDPDGKRRQLTKEFCQTINPFNKNAKGLLKTRQEIIEELSEEAKRWEDGIDVSRKD